MRDTHNSESTEQSTQEEGQGGYMRYLHTVAEKSYGPKCKFPVKVKVFNFVQHNTIRWDKEAAPFTYSRIAEAVGSTERTVKVVVKQLSKEKMLIVTKRNHGGRDLPNIIGLHPETFGDFIERSKRPQMSVIEGGKSQKLSTGVSDSTPRGVSDSTPQGCQGQHPEQGPDEPPEPEPSSLKNSSKEPIKELFRKIRDNSCQMKGEWGPEDREQRLRLLRQQAEQIEREERGFRQSHPC